MKPRSALLSLVFAVFANMHITVHAQVNEQDSLALVDLFNSTGGPNWNSHDNWLTAAPVASWWGITVTNNRVTGISLYSNNLTGSIPSSIGNLASLDTLILGLNQITALPPEFGNLASLKYLALYLNQLTSLPPEFGNLASLRELHLWNNQLTALPPEFGNLANLKYLYLFSNQLSGLPPEFGNLTSLRLLSLPWNQLTTFPPEFYNLANLRELYLGYNQLTSIPPEFGNLANLRVLSLPSNQLTSLPPEIGNLANLHYLRLSFNQLTSLPPEFGDLVSLRVLEFGNNPITALPPEFGNLASLQRLYLIRNQLTSLPPEFGNLSNLKQLYLEFNQLTSLPPEFGNLSRLRKVSLSGNQLTVIPQELYNLSSSLKLELGDNYFTFGVLKDVVQNFNVRYSPQANIPLHQNGSTLSVSAGGTLSNNTYKWVRIGPGGHQSHTIITGDSVFHPVHDGKYFCKVTNSICTRLTLFTDTIEYNAVAEVTTNNNTGLIKIPDNKKFTLAYPNPVRNILNIQTIGSASFSLLDQSGKIWLTTNINSSGSMNVSGMAAGLYYLKNNNNGAVQKVIIAR